MQLVLQMIDDSGKRLDLPATATEVNPENDSPRSKLAEECNKTGCKLFYGGKDSKGYIVVFPSNVGKNEEPLIERVPDVGAGAALLRGYQIGIGLDPANDIDPPADGAGDGDPPADGAERGADGRFKPRGGATE